MSHPQATLDVATLLNQAQEAQQLNAIGISTIPLYQLWILAESSRVVRAPRYRI